MKKKLNIISVLKHYKEKLVHESKFHFFTGILPAFGLCFIFYNVYKYKLYHMWRENIFTINEEKQIAKKIYPVLKYKNIEKLYSDSSEEYKEILRVYKNIISHLKMNLKSEVFLVKSDMLFLNILSTGSLFMSDALYQLVKQDKEILQFMIIHNIVHIRNRDTTKNIGKIFSKIELLKQYENLMKGETGYEHYFLHYYLYLPFSGEQEVVSIKETLRIMEEMNLNINKYNTIDKESDLLERIDILFKRMNKITQMEVKEIKRRLNLPNKQRIEKLKENVKKEFKNIFPNYTSSIINNTQEYYEDNLEGVDNIIYGDYKHKNENVEVFLHQRTTRKIKYKKREYDIIHPIDKKLIENNKNRFKS